MRFVPFELERWQSTWENRVRYNLSESGVHPLSIRELLELAGASAEPLLDVRLGYSQSNGTDLLRSRVAALYPGVSPDQILVTSGSAEAAKHMNLPGRSTDSPSPGRCGWYRTEPCKSAPSTLTH